jgi:hypothetical protein
MNQKKFVHLRNGKWRGILWRKRDNELQQGMNENLHGHAQHETKQTWYREAIQ